MTFIFLVVLVAIIILILFLYSLWKDDTQTLNVSELKENNISVSLKKSSIDPYLFTIGLNDIEIKNTDFKKLKEELHKKIMGMDEFINSILVNILVGGHLLVEGVPGLAKTKTIETLSQVLDMDFKRIQFTPDMLPADIIGSQIYNSKNKDFEVKKGPVFTNILLADEINRTTPKVQSALLEAMQEKKVSIGGKELTLPQPFFVLATQNPLEQEGTYPLPEAQIDRFLFKVLVDYPTKEDETVILNTLENEDKIKLSKLFTVSKFLKIQQEVQKIFISDDIKDYIVRLVGATRTFDGRVLYGSSPRGSIGLMFASKALAFLQGRDHVTHEDVQRLALNVLRHRIILTYDAIVQGYKSDEILIDIFSNITLE